MFTMLLQNFLPKYWPSDILFVGNINKYVIIMHLICINHNNIINEPFFAKKKVVAILFTCVLTSIAKISRRSAPLGPRSEGGGQIDPPPPPPPVKTCSQKAQLK